MRTHNRGRKARTAQEVIEFVRSKSTIDENGCLIWHGTIDSCGYSRLTWARPGKPTIFGGHRVSYVAVHGDPPEGLVLDHLCRVRRCVNPDHLEPVTIRENVRRSPLSVSSINAAKTHCPQGHPYSEENTGVARRDGRAVGRYCKTCMSKRGREASSARRAKAVAA